MNVSLAAQDLSRSVATMIRDAISDKTAKLPNKNKRIYNYLVDLSMWNMEHIIWYYKR